MRQLQQADGNYSLEGVSLATLAGEFGTPLYVYSRAAIEEAWQEWREALATLGEHCPAAAGDGNGRATLSYAVKANSNLAILRLFTELGAGFDVVSLGEIERVLAAGGQARNIVFSGVGKSRAEIAAACRLGIGAINLESSFEFDSLAAYLDETPPPAPVNVAVRMNPDITAGGHAYISTGAEDTKFGLPGAEALVVARQIHEHPRMAFAGLVSHIGSQIFDAEPYAQTFGQLLEASTELGKQGIATPTLGLGGGWGVADEDRERPCLSGLASALAQTAQRHNNASQAPCPALAFEPGRSLVAESGLLLSRVIGVKRQPERTFVVVDAAMNDYIRPALYGASQRIINARAGSGTPQRCHVVGPVCESGDFLAQDIELAAAAGDTLALLDAGAYGMSMSSNYNSRPRAAEVLIDGGQPRLIRQRETIEDLIASEKRLLGC